jgi:hypothetical protein
MKMPRHSKFFDRVIVYFGKLIGLLVRPGAKLFPGFLPGNKKIDKISSLFNMLLFGSFAANVYFSKN